MSKDDNAGRAAELRHVAQAFRDFHKRYGKANYANRDHIEEMAALQLKAAVDLGAFASAEYIELRHLISLPAAPIVDGHEKPESSVDLLGTAPYRAVWWLLKMKKLPAWMDGRSDMWFPDAYGGLADLIEQQANAIDDMSKNALYPSIEWLASVATFARRIAEAHKLPRRTERFTAAFVALDDLEKLRNPKFLPFGDGQRSAIHIRNAADPIRLHSALRTIYLGHDHLLTVFKVTDLCEGKLAIAESSKIENNPADSGVPFVNLPDYLQAVEYIEGIVNTWKLRTVLGALETQPAMAASRGLRIKQVAQQYQANASTVRRWCENEDNQKQYGIPPKDSKGWLIPHSATQHFPWRLKPALSAPAKPSTAGVFARNGSQPEPHQCNKCGDDFVGIPPRPRCPKCQSNSTSRITLKQTV